MSQVFEDPIVLFFFFFHKAVPNTPTSVSMVPIFNFKFKKGAERYVLHFNNTVFEAFE